MADLSGVFGRFGSSLYLARVDGYNTDTNDAGNDATDEVAGEAIPNGLLDITLMNREGSRTGVPFILPAGNSTFVGSLPEIGSTCIVGFDGQQQPLILGFMPPGLGNLIGSRGVIPNLNPGEVLLQSSTSDTDADGNDQQFVGAAVRLDNYGRIIVTCEDYKLTIGFLLSNENTPDVSSLNDPVNGEPIFLQETLPGGTQRRVGAGGSTVWQYGKDKAERIGGDVDTRVEGQMVTIVKSGMTFQDKKGNSFGLDTDGNFFFEGASSGYSMASQGPASTEISNSESYNTLRNYTRVVGGNHSTNIAGSRTLTMGSVAPVPTGELIFNLGPLGSQEYLVGAKLIQSVIGLVFNSLPAPTGVTGSPFVPVPPPPAPLVPLVPGGISMTGTSAIAMMAPQILLGSPILVPLPDAVTSTLKLAVFLTTLITALVSSPTPPPGAPLFPAGSALLGQINPGAALATLGSLIVKLAG